MIRTIDQWVTIFKTLRNATPLAIADRIFGDMLGYGNSRGHAQWRDQDNQQLANALEAYHQFEIQKRTNVWP